MNEAVQPKMADPSLISRLSAIVGEAHVLTGEADLKAFLQEPRGLFHGRALCAVRPASTAEVSAVLKLCHETQTPVVPQGGNTGLVGGQTANPDGRAIVLSLARMRRLREIDPASETMTVEAGMVLAQAQEEARRAGLMLALSMGSEGSCTIGGNLATNAGGIHVIAYGNARAQVLGLEVVLADGRILCDLSKLRKNNTGYDLKQLFIGSEGTLGVITAAVLKLHPGPHVIETAFTGLSSPQAAVSLLAFARSRAGAEITSFELIPRIGLEFDLRHFAGLRDGLAEQHRWYVLMELSSQSEEGLLARLEDLLAEAVEADMIEDAAIARSLEQRQNFWRLRECLPEAQSREGGSIKHDVSVPIAHIPAFLADVEEALASEAPGARLVAFGHVGDGNIHCNVSQPIGADKAGFLARLDEINEIVHGLVLAHQGSISAEHGIGQLKRDLLPKVKDKTAMELMRTIKLALDPRNILNPGKLL